MLNNSPSEAVLLLGGIGSRLSKYTSGSNKHLHPFLGRTLAEHALSYLQASGIKKVFIVSSPHDKDSYRTLFLPFSKDLEIYYKTQQAPLGTSHAVVCADLARNGGDFLVYFGDNIFESLQPQITGFMIKTNHDACIGLAEVLTPELYGVVELSRDNQIRSIVEKPSRPSSRFVCTGLFRFSRETIPLFSQVMPDNKGERNLMDVIRKIHQEGGLFHEKIDGWWLDAGASVAAWNEAEQIVRMQPPKWSVGFRCGEFK